MTKQDIILAERRRIVEGIALLVDEIEEQRHRDRRKLGQSDVEAIKMVARAIARGEL